ncbi:MAG: Rpn family recombination-promoting nuclease/putative transposase [Saprospiraceae bacterium]
MRQQKHVRFDWAIKRLLRQKANFNILEGFLSELLKDDIAIIEIIDTESNQETETDKFNRVDILVKDKKGELIIIEIQNSYAIDYFLRILYGISKAITEHIKTGDEWTSVKKVISINIVYFDLGRGEDYIYKGTTTFSGLHQNDELQLSNAQKKLFKKEKIRDLYPEIYLIKVNNFDDIAKDTLDEWIYFLKNSEIKKDFTAKGLKEAEEVLKVANMEDQERREYQRFGEVLSDRASQALSMRIEVEMAVEKERKAKKIAIEKERKAMEIVVKNERERAIVAMIRNTELLDKQIADALGVSVEMVKSIRDEMN